MVALKGQRCNALKLDQSNVFVNYSTRVDLNDSPPLPPPSYKQRDTNPGHLIFEVWRQATSQGYINREKEGRRKGFPGIFTYYRSRISGLIDRDVSQGFCGLSRPTTRGGGVTSASGLTTGIDNVAERYTEPG